MKSIHKAILVTLVFFIYSIMILALNYFGQEIKTEVDCYDSRDNKIKDLDCIKTSNTLLDKFGPLSIIIFMLIVGYIFFMLPWEEFY